MAINRPKLAIGFVIYRPTRSFYKRLEIINKLDVSFYIYDNSPEITATKEMIGSLPCGRYLSSGKNEGLGWGLSELCQKAYQEDFECLLFFDQDTGFNSETISFIQSFMSENIASLSKNYSAIVFSGAGINSLKNVDGLPVIPVDFAINSGSLFILESLKKLGWHDKSYFVDGVDYEFCLRSHITGFRVGKHFNTPSFDHESEQPDQVVTVFGKRLLIRKYSYVRIKDSVHSYIRLIFQALANGRLIFAIKIIRSFLIYIAGQFLSRLL